MSKNDGYHIDLGVGFIIGISILAIIGISYFSKDLFKKR